MITISIIIFLLLVSPMVFAFMLMRSGYTKSTYSKETNNKFMKVMRDAGLRGEYYTAKKLDNLAGYHKTLINAYIPKVKGGTSEIDVLFIHETGIYVLESKNYSGWIFGNESDKNWTQSFPNGKKQSFYNPIKQNEGHMKAIKNFLNDISESHFKSMIVFSERCELKKVTVHSSDIAVLKREKLKQIIKKEIKNSATVLTKDEIDEIYNKIKPHCHVSDIVKQSHIENVKSLK